MSQQQNVTKAQGNRANGNQSVKSIEAENQQDERQTPAKLSVPDDTVASTSMNDIEVNERGEIVASAEASDSTSTTPNNAPARKKRRKKYREVFVDASEVMPRPSIWPLMLAFSIAVVLFGLIWNAIILFVGLALLVASIIGWSLEKRDHTYKSAVPVNKSGVRDANVPAGSSEQSRKE